MDVHSIKMAENPHILFADGWQNWLITHFQSIISAKRIPSKVLCFSQMCTILRRVTSYILGTVWPEKRCAFMHFYWKIKMTKKMSDFYFFDVFEFSRPLWATKNNSKSRFKETAFSTTSDMNRMTLGPKL